MCLNLFLAVTKILKCAGSKSYSDGNNSNDPNIINTEEESNDNLQKFLNEFFSEYEMEYYPQSDKTYTRVFDNNIDKHSNPVESVKPDQCAANLSLSYNHSTSVFNTNSPNAFEQLTTDCDQSKNDKNFVSQCDLSNINSNIQIENNQISDPKDHSNVSGIDKCMTKQLSIFKIHINFMEDIVDDISAECDRFAKYGLEDVTSLFCPAECKKILEEFKKIYSQKNSKNSRVCAGEVKVNKPNKFAKNSKITEETELFLKFLNTLTTEDNNEASGTKYYQSLISYIDSRTKKTSRAQNPNNKDKKVIPVEKQRPFAKKRALSTSKKNNEISDDSPLAKRSKIPAEYVFKRVLFSKKFFYLVYYEKADTYSTTILLRYKYKDSSYDNIKDFSVKNLDLESEEIMQLPKCYRSIFLDPNGTFYVHVFYPGERRKQFYSCIKKFEEENLNLNLAIDEKNDLVLENVKIEKFIVHHDKIYVLDFENRKMLIFSTNFDKIGEVKYETDQKIKFDAQRHLLVIQEHILVIIDFTIFTWKVDSENKKFEMANCEYLNKKNPIFDKYYGHDKFFLRHNFTSSFGICEIEIKGNLLSFQSEYFMIIPRELWNKNCEVFNYSDGNVYCAFFENGKELKITKIDGSIILDKYKKNF